MQEDCDRVNAELAERRRKRGHKDGDVSCHRVLCFFSQLWSNSDCSPWVSVLISSLRFVLSFKSSGTLPHVLMYLPFQAEVADDEDAWNDESTES